MARKHGSGSACYELNLSIKCEECREYHRARQRRLRQTPGTYRYMAAHGENTPGMINRFGKRRRDRGIADIRDTQTLKELFSGHSETN